MNASDDRITLARLLRLEDRTLDLEMRLRSVERTVEDHSQRLLTNKVAFEQAKQNYQISRQRFDRQHGVPSHDGDGR